MPRRIWEPVVEHHPLDGGFLVENQMPFDFNQFFDNYECGSSENEEISFLLSLSQQEPSSKLGDVFTGQKLDFIPNFVLKAILSDSFKEEYSKYNAHVYINLSSVGNPYHITSLFNKIDGIKVEVKQGFGGYGGALLISGSVEDVLQTMNNMHISKEKSQTFRLDAYDREYFTFAFWVSPYYSDEYMHRDYYPTSEKLLRWSFEPYELMVFEVPWDNLAPPILS